MSSVRVTEKLHDWRNYGVKGKAAILAAHTAEQYGKEIGYAVRFDQESVKCMAITVLIGMQGGRY